MRALIFVAALSGSYAVAADSSVTFHKDVLPILQQHCQTCHRSGSIAPMSFLTYQSTRPWAKAMKAAVLSRKMPPWSADPNVGHFSNDPSLKPNELEIISRWADSGAPAGDENDAPPPIQWPASGWTTQPDIVLKGVPYTVPAHVKNDVVEWMTLITPTGFTRDMWITSVEIKPSELAVTHHICVSFVPHRPNVSYNTLLWVDKQRDEAGVEVAPSERRRALPTADGKGIEAPAGVRNRAGANGAGAGAVGIGFTCSCAGPGAFRFPPISCGAAGSRRL